MAQLSAVFPSWDQLDFARNCTAYGQWLSAFIAPNPWNPVDALSGSVPLSLELFTAALPPNWTWNVPSSDASAGPLHLTAAQLSQSPAGTAFFGLVMQWFTTQLYARYDTAADFWYTDVVFVDRVIWAPADVCPTSFCKAIALTGNADLAGIGVLTAYYIEAAFVTLYLVLSTVWRLGRLVRRWRRPFAAHGDGRFLDRVARRVFDAARGSLFSTNVCATVLALSVLLAALVMAGKHATENSRRPVDQQNIPSGHALYDSALALLVSLFTVLPVAVLYALAPSEADDRVLSAQLKQPPHQLHVDLGRRRGMRRGLLVVLWALVAALVFLDPRSELDYDFQGVVPGEDADVATDAATDVTATRIDYAAVLYTCDQRGGRGYWRALWALKFLVVGLPLAWLLATAGVYMATRTRRKRKQNIKGTAWVADLVALVLSLQRKDVDLADGPDSDDSPNHDRSDRGQRLRLAWRQAIAWVNCGLMWAVLLCLTELRADIVAVAGGLDPMNTWTFAQIIPLVSWSPVVADFTFLVLFGLEEGLDGHLPADMTVRQVAMTSVCPSHGAMEPATISAASPQWPSHTTLNKTARTGTAHSTSIRRVRTAPAKHPLYPPCAATPVSVGHGHSEGHA